MQNEIELNKHIKIKIIFRRIIDPPRFGTHAHARARTHTNTCMHTDAYTQTDGRTDSLAHSLSVTLASCLPLSFTPSRTRAGTHTHTTNTYTPCSKQRVDISVRSTSNSGIVHMSCPLTLTSSTLARKCSTNETLRQECGRSTTLFM
jgi:hypothetical protein